MDHPISLETFSVSQAADSLGRSLATIRRWIADDKMPAPYLTDLARHNKVYSAGELRVVASILSQYEREFAYLTSEHNHIVESLRQAVHAYRSQYL